MSRVAVVNDPRQEAQHGCFEVGEVLAHGGSEDGVRGIEVAVGEAVAHARDLRPRLTRLAAQQPFGKGLDRLADLDEADARRRR